MNQSIRIQNTVELINLTPVNPLISKCQIKVCYVGDQPNRNKSIITKEVAYELANSLPGSPIVGYYNEDKRDFEGHNRTLAIENGKVLMKDDTRPYGFVDLNAKVWFEKFNDNGVIHEYLMTEGWIWTGQYPEAKRIVDQGNNQSMELDDKIIDAYWTKDCNGKREFFIINEAIVSKLCVLGSDVEPCFEGANITAYELNFSLEEAFKVKMYALMEEMKTILEGGTSDMDNSEMLENVEEVLPPVVEEGAPIEEPIPEEGNEPTGDDQVEEVPAAEPQEETPADEEPGEPAAAGEPEPEAEPAAEEEPAATYDLNNVVEYQNLMVQHAQLEADHNTLQTEYSELDSKYNALVEEVKTLRTFKATIDKQEKERMINSFYMLSDEDKKDVIENIDTYSVDDIEAKLSIICVRNKVSFNLEEENDKSEKEPIVYNFSSAEECSVPAWVKSLQSVAETLK